MQCSFNYGFTCVLTHLWSDVVGYGGQRHVINVGTRVCCGHEPYFLRPARNRSTMYKVDSVLGDSLV